MGNGGINITYFFLKQLHSLMFLYISIYVLPPLFYDLFFNGLLYRKSFEIKELITGLLVIVGIIIIVNNFNYESHPKYLKSVIFALTSAFLAAFFSVINSARV